jgi:hypothetical protein
LRTGIIEKKKIKKLKKRERSLRKPNRERVRAAHPHHTKLLLLSISLVESFFLLTHATLLFWVLLCSLLLCRFLFGCSIPFSSNNFLSFLSQKRKKKKDKQKQKEIN